MTWDAGPVIGVVPLAADEPSAPHGCSGLRRLAGCTLAERAWRVLAGVPQVNRVLLAVPADLPPVALGAADPERTLAVARGGLLDLVAAAASVAPADGLLVVHLPCCALAPAALLIDVLQALTARPGAAGVVAVQPVTDTLKRIDPAGNVHETVDRAGYRVALTPQAYRVGVLRRALDGGAAGRPPADGHDPGALVRAVAPHGPLVQVEHRGQLPVVDSDDALELAVASIAA